jgi:hypothetical protein
MQQHLKSLPASADHVDESYVTPPNPVILHLFAERLDSNYDMSIT